MYDQNLDRVNKFRAVLSSVPTAVMYGVLYEVVTSAAIFIKVRVARDSGLCLIVLMQQDSKLQEDDAVLERGLPAHIGERGAGELAGGGASGEQCSRDGALPRYFVSFAM